MAVEVHVFKTIDDAGSQALTEVQDTSTLIRLFGSNDRAGFSESDDGGNVERARTHPFLLAAAIDYRLHPRAYVSTSYVNRAHSFWTIKLMSTERREVQAK